MCDLEHNSTISVCLLMFVSVAVLILRLCSFQTTCDLQHPNYLL